MIAFLAMRRKKGRPIRVAEPKITLCKLAGYLVTVFSLHIAAMMVFESMSFKDSFWLTWTTITTVGYGDVSAKTWPGRLSTILFVYIGGIFVLADAASKYFTYRAYSLDRKLTGNWRWKMKDHIIIIGSPDRNAKTIFSKLVTQIRNTVELKDSPVLLLTKSIEGNLPEFLVRQSVAHVRGDGLINEDLTAASIGTASHVIILSDAESENADDCRTLDILDRIHNVLEFKGTSVVECVNDSNRERAMARGADAIIRPSRGYPEMIIRALVSPGSEKILENLFDAEGEEICRIEFTRPIGMLWRDVATRIILSGAGTPLGYQSGSKMITNPLPDALVDTGPIFVIVGDHQPDPTKIIESALFDSDDGDSGSSPDTDGAIAA